MKADFFKFPSTPHLGVLAGVEVRGDKILSHSERNEFLAHALTVEEKVDGANLGISFDADGAIRVQNRGSYLFPPFSGQWKKLDEWLSMHTDALFERLLDRFILFGEWCYARHSIYYNRLPDWFLAFDVYDRAARRFLSVTQRDRLLEKMRLCKVPLIGHGHFTYHDIQRLLAQSTLTDQPMEGIYLRRDLGKWLEQRAKLVRPAFIQAVEQHWSRSTIEPNRLHVVPEDRGHHPAGSLEG